MFTTLKLTNKTLTARVLEFIAKSGTRGVCLSEIQEFILTSKNKKNIYIDRNGDTKKARGYWCTQLYGSYDRLGLLTRFCEKVPSTTKWKLRIIPNSPFYVSYKDYNNGIKDADLLRTKLYTL